MRVITFVRIVVAAGAVALFLTAPAARADGFALDRFDPAPAGDPFHVVESADTPGRFGFAARVAGGVAIEPLVLTRERDDARFALVERTYFAHGGVAVVLADRVKLALDVPVLVSTGEPAGSRAVPDGAAAGDVRLSGRIRVAGEDDGDVRVALGLRVWAPTGNTERFAGDPRARVGAVAIFEGREDDLKWGIVPGIVVRDEVVFEDVTLSDELTLAAGVAFEAVRDRFELTAETFGSVGLRGDDSFSAATTSVEVLAGASIRMGPLVMGPAVGPGLAPGVGTPLVRGLFRVTFAPPPERDEDDSHEPPPPPPLDVDGDGLVPPDDLCPEQPGLARALRSGCPDGAAIAVGPGGDDEDGDGVPDVEDRCPTIVGVDAPGPSRGCPEDSDGDGARDDVDACPNERGPSSEDLTESGCPTAVRVTPDSIELIVPLPFAAGSSELSRSADALLGQVVGALADHPEIDRLTIEVAAASEALGRARATSIKDRLIVLGVEPARLSTRGMAGEARVRFLKTAK